MCLKTIINTNTDTLDFIKCVLLFSFKVEKHKEKKLTRLREL